MATGCMTAANAKVRLAKLAAIGVLALGAVAVWADDARAQSTISSTGQLEQACETSPGNVVGVGSDVKINSGVANSGAFAPAYEQVATGCTIRLAGGAKFETDGVAMSFGGPFVVEGAGKGSAVFVKSAWKAPSMSFALPGADSEFRTDTSRLEATSGNIDVATGPEADLQFQYMSGVVYALKAAGDVNISGGDKTFFNVFQTSLSATGKLNVEMRGRDATLKLAGRPNLGGGAGVGIDLGGGAPTLSAEDAALSSFSGSVGISSPAQKALVELKSSRLFGRGDTTVSLPGSEAAIKSSLSRFQSEVGRVDLLAGGPGSTVGTVELSGSDVYSATGTSIQGSPAGEKGTVKVVGGSTVRGGSGDVLIRTGTAGTTEVKDTAIWSSTVIRILTGAGGTCVAQNNSYISPARQICQ